MQADNRKSNHGPKSGKKARKQQREQDEVAWLQPKLAGLQVLQHWATKLAAHELPAACCNMQQVSDGAVVPHDFGNRVTPPRVRNLHRLSSPLTQRQGLTTLCSADHADHCNVCGYKTAHGARQRQQGHF